MSEDPLLRVLRARPVQFAYVFGSTASGKAGPRSDLDLAVYLEPRLTRIERMRLRLGLLRELSALPGAAGGVDLAVLNDCPLNLAFSVVQGGRLLLSRNERRRVLFEAGVRSRYFDRLHYIRRGAGRVLEKVSRRGVLGRW